MKILALLNWFDEKPEWLDKSIRSLAKADVDHVVAVDGAYALYPDAMPQSPPEQADTIRTVCEELGMGHTVHSQPGLWSGEVEKRTFLFQLSEQVAQPNIDWLWVWDADQVLRRADGIKLALSSTTFDVADIKVIERPDPGLANTPRHKGTSVPVPSKFDIRSLFRAIPGIYVHENHYTYKTPDGRVLWGNPAVNDLAPSLDLTTTVRCSHNTYLREQGRRAKAVRYYLDRDRSGIEVLTCADCDARATRTARVDWEMHPDGHHLIAAQVPCCERHFQIRLGREAKNLQRLGVPPDTPLQWAGKVSVPD